MTSIQVIYGDNPQAMIREVLDRLRPGAGLSADTSIAIKPNLVNASPAEKGATTSPRLVEGIIVYLQDQGLSELTIMEGSWAGGSTDRAFRKCGYRELSRKYGVPLVDLKQDSYREFSAGNLTLKVCEQPLAVDYLINVPVLKAHSQADLTCALKNLKGCIPDTEKRRYHRLGLDRPIAALNTVLQSDLIIVDALQGDLTFEDGGNPVTMNRLLVGKDPVAIDAYGARLIGYKPHDIEYIELAAELGLGSSDLSEIEIVEYNQGLKDKSSFQHSRKTRRLARRLEAREACSACYGSLLHALQRLKETGELDELERIYIGQGFQGKSRSGPGIGNCTREFERFLPGCPPSAGEIREFLRNV
ncbi:MAG: DUF362 domain-containing protein [Bacillota bacterium]